MANKILIEKDIYVRDNYRIRRRAFVAGEEVEAYVYNAILNSNTVVNPEDLPLAPAPNSRTSLHSKPVMETKVLDDSAKAIDFVTAEEQKEEAKAPKKAVKKEK